MHSLFLLGGVAQSALFLFVEVIVKEPVSMAATRWALLQVGLGVFTTHWCVDNR